MIKCPVCEKHDFIADNDFAICPVCGWENDATQIDDPEEIGANCVSLNAARRAWQEKAANNN